MAFGVRKSAFLVSFPSRPLTRVLPSSLGDSIDRDVVAEDIRTSLGSLFFHSPQQSQRLLPLARSTTGRDSGIPRIGIRRDPLVPHAVKRRDCFSPPDTRGTRSPTRPLTVIQGHTSCFLSCPHFFSIGAFLGTKNSINIKSFSLARQLLHSPEICLV